MSDNYAGQTTQNFPRRPITPPTDALKANLNPPPVHYQQANSMMGSTIPSTQNPPMVPPRHDQHQSVPSATGQSRTYKSSNRNETTQRIEHEVLRILQWKNPVRSGVILFVIISSLIMTRWYSLLQLGSALLTIAIGINLVYVNLRRQTSKVLTNEEGPHPYGDVIRSDNPTAINRDSVNYYSNVLVDISETVIRALTRILFVENTVTSVKWMIIFFIVWKVSARLSTMDILLGAILSAFTFPRLYISNKDIVDAQIRRGQTLIQKGFEQAQHAATDGVHGAYDKTRSFVAGVGTTETDAKNTLRHTSVTTKED